MADKHYIGFEIHTIDRLIGRSTELITRPLLGDDMPALGGWILGYLYRHQGQPLYQKDIEHKFCMPPSTVTKLIKQLEKAGYLTRLSVEGDARLKQLKLLPKGEQLHRDIIATIHTAVDGALLSGMSEEEVEQLFYLLSKVRENAASLSEKAGAQLTEVKEKQHTW